MKLSSALESLVRSGVRRIGEIAIVPRRAGFLLHHHLDHPDDVALAHHGDPETARNIATFSAEGDYRVSKSEASLRRGWLLELANSTALLLALDHFYPAAVGLYLAYRKGELETQDLREKLNRQTGMYIGAKFISTAGAQALITATCGPGHRCQKRILWQIDAATPLDNSPASRFDGYPDGHDETNAIPLLCREACNLTVADCRRVAKEERGRKTEIPPA